MSEKERIDELLERYGYGDAPPAEQRAWLTHSLGKIRAAEARRKQLMELVAEGHNISESCRMMGINRKTYEAWRRQHPQFRDAMDKLRMTKKENPDDAPDWDGQFISFRKRFFGWDTYWHQRQIINAIESSKHGRITMALCPPEHGKTTVLEDYINYKLAVDPNHRITYVHESQNFARRVLRRVSQRMRDAEQFPEYIGRFGPFYVDGQERQGKPWSADMLTVAHAQHDERDYSLQVRGWSSSVQGTRTDLLLIDDVQALKSLSQTQSIMATLRQDYFSRPGKKGRIVMVGTRVGIGDVYETFLKDPGLADIIDLIQLPALGKDGEPLCPEMWTKKDLETKRKLVGEDAWWRNYQQNPLASGGQTFNGDMIDRAKDSQLIACQARSEPTVLAVDPALSGQNSIIVASYDSKQLKLIDLRCEENLARTEAIISGIADFAVRYRPNDVVIETAAFQAGLARDERLLRLAKQHGFRIREHTTSRAKSDPILGVASMASGFIREEIRIPWGTQLAEGRFAPLIAELLSWRADIPTKHLKQDNVMSLWFAWKFWMERRQQLGFDVSNWNFDGIPWRSE